MQNKKFLTLFLVLTAFSTMPKLGMTQTELREEPMAIPAPEAVSDFLLHEVDD